jgi:energy-coupling factor transport system ATP-binding protein
MSLLAGLIVPTAGSCLLDGRPITEQPDRIGLLLQNTRLQLSRPTVDEELDDMAKDRSAISVVVRRLGLGSLLQRRIDELSGGQQRRVGLAGAILRNADVILLDEPLAGLDRGSALGLVDSLEAVRSDSIIVVVTHDLDATSTILNHGSSGRILRIHGGRVDELERL